MLSDSLVPDFLFDPQLRAVDAKIKQAIDYWLALRGDRFAPSRGDLNPRDMKPFLSHLQIFDLLDGGRAYRPRLMGTAIVSEIKEDATGQVFDASSPRPVVHRVLSAIKWVMDNRKPLRTFAARSAVEERDHISHETVFLPLSNDGESIDMLAVVGVFTPIAR
ncbi:MAG: PAS domain-containing protein [Alphaproteobacteria bacterium]|nr:PAS domain-containing protein [Alphaproteobacteria bacterium]